MGNYKGVYLKGPLEEVAFPSQDYAQPVHYIKDQALLEKEMETHSSALVWKIPWTEEPGRYSLWGCKELDTTEQLHFLSFFLSLSSLGHSCSCTKLYSQPGCLHLEVSLLTVLNRGIPQMPMPGPPYQGKRSSFKTLSSTLIQYSGLFHS